jgi:hypothetical protein
VLTEIFIVMPHPDIITKELRKIVEAVFQVVNPIIGLASLDVSFDLLFLE